METGHVIFAIVGLFGHEKSPNYANIIHKIYFIVLKKKVMTFFSFYETGLKMSIYSLVLIYSLC